MNGIVCKGYNRNEGTIDDYMCITVLFNIFVTSQYKYLCVCDSGT